MLQKLSNIYISTTEIQKVAKEIGSQLVSIEDQLIENPKEYKKAKKKIDKMVISMDGAKIKTNDGWKEVKSGVVYELDSKSGKKKKCSYVSRIEYFIDFGKRLKEEARRRHYLDTNHLITIGDGAKWIWDLVEKDYLNSIQIVDWYHAKQHLYNIIKLLFGDKKDTETQLFTEKLIELLYNGNIKRFV